MGRIMTSSANVGCPAMEAHTVKDRTTVVRAEESSFFTSSTSRSGSMVNGKCKSRSGFARIPGFVFRSESLASAGKLADFATVGPERVMDDFE